MSAKQMCIPRYVPLFPSEEVDPVSFIYMHSLRRPLSPVFCEEDLYGVQTALLIFLALKALTPSL